MIKQTVRRVILVSYVDMFPIPVVIAEEKQKDNEKLYASVPNNYVENVIPGNIDLFDENSQTWKYSDEWNFASNKALLQNLCKLHRIA